MLKPNRFLGIIALFLFAVIMGSCGGGGGGGGGEAPPVTYKIAEYYPLAQGDTWTYRDTENGKITYRNLTVSDTETIGGVVTTKVVTSDGSYELYTVDSNGVTFYKSYDVESGGWEQTVFTPPLNFLPAEVSVGTKKTFNSTMNFANSKGETWTTTISGEVIVAGVEDVTVLAGTFKGCLKITLKFSGTYPEGTFSHEETSWFAKGIGEVKDSSKNTDPDGSVHNESLELVSAKVGGVSYGNLNYPYIYELWGGSTSLSGINGYTPEKYGYTLLGISSTTQTFSGLYPYYYIVTKGGNSIKLDAIQFSDGSYLPGAAYLWTGGVINWNNAKGAPDGVTALVGSEYWGGYFGFQNVINSTSIKVYVVQP